MTTTFLRSALAAFALVAITAPAAGAFEVRGRFLYEDRLYDGNGYTGTVQNLPIRRTKVELVNAATQTVLATGTTGADGRYLLTATSAIPVNLYVRSITDGRPAGYQMRVVDNFVRVPTVGLNLTGSQLYSISTATTVAHNPVNNLDLGDYLIQDLDGFGVAQAFNIFDNGVDFFDWLAQPGLNGALPTAAQFLVFAWKATGTPGNPPPQFGSNYSQQGVFIGADPTADTDGWSDTVILHETGHWLDDVFARSDNPGGAHFIGDNDANVLLAFGEGMATFHCAKVREWRSARPNLVGQPIDRLVSLYADLELPPPVGTPGALSFAYDFETGNFANTGLPIGQRGSANETNVTSALWDMMDGIASPDATPGADDDALEASDSEAWQIEVPYILALSTANPLTVEDFYQGWFATKGAGFAQAAMNGIFVTLARMPFAADALEPDGSTAAARPVTPVPYGVSPSGKVVINDLDLGAADAIELMNTSDVAVDMEGWQIEVYANGTQQDASRIYTFPPFTLQPGECVALH
ncbi:MAG: lamin tail domain-containing protein, partial [Candidatus Eisenbacteria bacterium]